MGRPAIINLLLSFITSLFITYVFFMFIIMKSNPFEWVMDERTLFSIISVFMSFIIFPFYHMKNGKQKVS